MKILKLFDGFVTNSSSVNFLIATKEELTKEQLKMQLKKNYKTRIKASYFARELLERVCLEGKPYEYDFYKVTIGKGFSHYYPGKFPNDDHRLWPLHGMKIEDEDFLLCIGFFEKLPFWQKKYLQKVKIGKNETQMYGVTLWYSGYGLKSIDQIQNLHELKNLFILNLDSNEITELKGLEGLTSIRSLNLSNNHIKKIEGLDELVNLEVLNLGGNQIKVIEGLNYLSKLDSLFLRNNQIYEINNLNLPNLEDLDLSENQISEIEGLEQFPNIISLRLGKNPIREIRNLDHLKNLKYLDLEGTLIQEIKGLDSLVNLISLDLSHTKINKIKGLENLTQLKSLYLKDTNIPEDLIADLGGQDFGGVNRPQKFVEYCKENK